VDAPSASTRPIRSFVAIEVGEPARAAIEACLVGLRDELTDVAWTPPQNLHLTLKFLGSVLPEGVASLADSLAGIAATQPAFEVAFRGVGAFPSANRPRVLWVGAAADPLVQLAGAVEVASIAVGVAPETRPYHPHVTLGRVRTPARSSATSKAGGRAITRVLERERDRAFGVAPAIDMVLFRSDTSSKGAVHTPIVRFALGDRD
jgi:RNA 2',3'-cyclic 3'-phosphodiesterase